MDGMGVYKWRDGSIFKGEWKDNLMNGCGKKWYPGNIVEEGEWVNDMFAGAFSSCDDVTARVRAPNRHCGRVEGKLCSFIPAVGKSARQETANEAERVSREAKMFMLKPGGPVKRSEGVDLDQDPVQYKEGEEHLMPGPAGKLFNGPWNRRESRRMQRHAQQAVDIYRRYNPHVPRRTTLKKLAKERERMAKDEERKKNKEIERATTVSSRGAGVEEEADEEEDDEEDEGGGQGSRGPLDRLRRRLPGGRGKSASVTMSFAQARGAFAKAAQRLPRLGGGGRSQE